MADVELVEVMRALSDPIRLTLLSVMSDGEFHSCSPESWGVDLHKSTLSHHFKVLRDAGVTTTRVSGRNRDTRLRKAELDDRFPGLIDSLVTGLRISQNA
jgi:DNA-binding transcriptional ArsR family regulator